MDENNMNQNNGMPEGTPQQDMNQGGYTAPQQDMNQGGYTAPQQDMNQGGYTAPQQNYNYSNGPVPVQTTDNSKYAVIGLVCSICGILGICVPIAGIVLGSIGITMGKKASNSSSAGMAKAAFIIGIIVVAISAIIWILSIVFNVGSVLSGYNY